jgi:hypothetical protein
VFVVRSLQKSLICVVMLQELWKWACSLCFHIDQV